MKITAIICEYNPFHKGHLLQISQLKKNNDTVICIMSGGFVQRGEPAVFDKYERAKAAVSCGADIVFELPFPFSCSAAEFFASGAVSLASSLNVVDRLCFGSECGNINMLKAVSNNVNSPEFKKALSDARNNKDNANVPFAYLKENVYRSLYGQDFPVLPNDILGLEYINALSKLKSNIEPYTYKREKGFSATESRRLLFENGSLEAIPEGARAVFENAPHYRMKHAERAILAFYRGADPKELKKHEGMSNGLAERIVKGAVSSTDLEGLIEYLSGKSYTNARIRRAIINGMTGTLPEMLKCKPLFTSVLAASDNGRRLLREITKKADIDIITKPAHFKKLSGKSKEQALFAQKADALLTLMCEKTKEADYFLKQKPYIYITKGEN